MLKQVDITPAIKAKLQAAVGGDADTKVGDLAVFEAQAVNTRPLVRRTNGIFQNSVVGIDTLQAMHSQIARGDTVPIKTMHESELPTGRTFMSGIHPAGEGHSALHTLFYVNGKTHPAIVASLNDGTLQDVSVGFQGGKLLCSECAFDYASDEATFENFYECTCNADHKIGKDGVHVRVHGLSSFNELSLVDRGACSGSMILGRKDQPLARSAEMSAFFSARGFDPRLLECQFSVMDTGVSQTPAPNKEDSNMPGMTDKEIMELGVKSAIAERDVATLTLAATKAAEAHTAALAELQTKLSAAEAKIVALGTGDLAVLTTEVTSVKADLKLAMDAIDARLKASFALTGEPEKALPATVKEKVELLATLQAALKTAIPVGGAHASATADKPTLPANLTAFTRRK